MIKQFNSQQLTAINARGQNLILSAAAGSGKTAVLIDRLSKIISDENDKTPVEQIIVVTFTNAAASEMKLRLQKSLTDLLINDPYNDWLLEQEINLKNAKISTINSFCFDLVRENSYKLGIEQNFRIGDENEVNLLTEKAIKAVLERAYITYSDEMSFICNTLCKQNDENLEIIIDKLLKFSHNVPCFENWVADFKTPTESIKKTLLTFIEENVENAEYADCLKHFDEDIATTEKLFFILTTLVLQIKKTLFEYKKEKNMLAFDDAERLTLELLSDIDFTKNLREFYKYVLIDEYQDVNECQDLIFKLISNGKNLFVVGDLKQSIYKFRGSEPKIFQDTLNNSIDFENSDSDSKLYLNKNYRSGKAIIDFVNLVFENIMQEYSGNERLFQGSELDGNVEMIEYENKQEQQFVALKIKELLAKYEPKDICILTRTRSKADKFVQSLKKFNIPANGESEISFLDSSEIATLINLLRVIDDPLQEKPLLSVLLSPMFGFSIEEIAKIRKFDVKLYNSLIENKNEKTENFLSILSELRLLATRITAEELILAIYDKTDFLNLMQTFSDAEQKKSNLRLLISYAKQFEEQSPSLRGFLQFLSKMKNFNIKDSATPANNAVSCMTIHKSKGLEFPVVFLVGNDRKFTLDKSPYFFDKEIGFGFKMHNKYMFVKYTTASFLAAQKKSNDSEKSEEMRMLYVALTRAKEHLFVTLDKKTGVIPPENANCYADWLKYVLDKIEYKTSKIIEIEDKNENINIQKKSKLNIKFSNEILSPPTPLRVTVTELKNADTEMQTPNILSNEITLKRPKFITETTELSGAEKGTVLHTFLRFVDFHNDLNTELENIVTKNILTQKEVATINKTRLKTFYQSDLHTRIINAEKIEREKQFFVAIKNLKNIPIENFNNSYLMGVIDLILYENDGLVLVDYKTDYVNSPSELIEKYSKQLLLYKSALELIENRKVKESRIYSFSLQKQVNFY
ncbi:ATP-dependent helicase/nuclease subunit A [Clostridia bacterium]|nr:ATP-dependent helicase/nuclease subunit A [Clostridia bacterium]